MSKIFERFRKRMDLFVARQLHDLSNPLMPPKFFLSILVVQTLKALFAWSSTHFPDKSIINPGQNSVIRLVTLLLRQAFELEFSYLFNHP